MNWFTGILVYLVIWWVVLFMVLPFGVRTADEVNQAVEPGHATSAPVEPRLLLKFLVTTAIATVLFLAFWLIQRYQLLDVRELVG